MKKILFLCSGLLLLLSGCLNDPEKDIKKVVTTFFKEYKGDFRAADKALISTELAGLIDKAAAKELQEAENMKKSAFPTDKPIMIEGDIFTSLYEGQNAFTIGEITIEGSKATVTVDFKNTLYAINWKDKVALIQDGSGWKIDDVYYKEQESSGSTKKQLQQVILAKGVPVE
ncbi:DUF3828 domain-containing protein [Flavobacterium kingsejongi]|uniref:Uncharacterized protein n=1 Tax=Flavobacterium kingsejongi TaxID=1678728 RepID=A0A2S1LMZ1_9FLAO|nr:DUF3828 domain-containing protein [Flavobacterium kingsejongi]AWG25094.1 hypothetical protein FK004_07530 [Flavobacterium kingsejongi]